MRRPFATAILVATFAAAAGAAEPVHLDEHGRPRDAHDATSHRRFDDVERWSAIFEDPARETWQKPAEVVKALGLRPGMVVADIGAGTGYFVGYLSSAVGRDGTVLAIEVEPTLVEHLRTRAEKEETANVTPVLASYTPSYQM